MRDGAHENFYWVLPTNGIFCLVNILSKALQVVVFNKAHTSVIQSADVLVDFPLFVVRLVVEVVSPMAEITWNHEDSILIIEIFC